MKTGMRLFLAAAILLSAGLILAQNKVGIGTITPAYLLDVQGLPTSSSVVNLNSKVNYSGAVDISAVVGHSVTMDGYGIGGTFTGGYKGIDAAALGGGFTGSIYGIRSVATGTAGTRFGVHGTALGGGLNIGVFGEAIGGTGYFAVYGNNSNTAGYAGYFNGRGYFAEELRADKSMIVDDNLGIGTLTPATRLHIPIGSDASYTTNGFIQTGITGGWNMVIDDNELLARNNGLENEMFIQRDGGDLLLCALELGSVGIGLTAGSSIPNGYMLAVDGKIISEELRIQNSNNWPDYVFAENYALMPLDELQRSIQDNRRLPNIPSAQTVAENGILIGDMQKRMMEKIEELTLYILQLNETIQFQQRQLDEQGIALQQLKEK